MFNLFGKTVENPKLVQVEIVLTTIRNRAGAYRPWHTVSEEASQRIAKNIADGAPATGRDRFVDYLVCEIDREEFSIAEDMVDGSCL